MREAVFEIVSGETTAEVLVLRDVGDHALYPTITNGAEALIARLWKAGVLTPGRRVLYYDSEQDLGELLWSDGGKFMGFGPGRR